MHRSDDYRDILLGVLSTGGLLICGLGALCTAALTLWIPEEAAPGQYNLQLWTSMALTATALIGIPGLVAAVRGILNDHHPQAKKPSTWWLLALLSLPLAALVNYLVYERELLPASFGLTTNLLTACFAVALSVQIVRRNAPPVSTRRTWGQFLTGLYAVPPLILTFELAALIPIAALIAASFMSSALPAFSLDTLMDPTFDPQNYFEQLDLQTITDPGSIVLLTSYLGIIVPMIEELLKTSALWFVIRRISNPGEAYLAGALTGAGYGFFEALMLSQPGPDWVKIGLLRIGATLLHSAAAGLTAWGFYMAVKSRKWYTALWTYTAAVFIHGIWNLNAITMSWVAAGAMDLPFTDTLNQQVLSVLPLFLFFVLSLASLVSLPLMSRWTAQQGPVQPAPPVPSVDGTVLFAAASQTITDTRPDDQT